MHTLDVVVVGAGPAGLSAALLLAAEGCGVIGLGAHAALGGPARCTRVTSRGVSGPSKVPETIVLSRPSSCAIVTASGRAVGLSAGDERIAVIDRAQFDAELGSAALRGGAEIRTGFRVDRVHVEPRRVLATSAEGEG